jgi:heptosyltransferase III
VRALERGFKRGLIRLAPVLYPPRKGARPLRRVLLVRIDDRLGNLVLLTPALVWLKERRPDLEIDLLLSRTFAPIFEVDTRVARRVIVDKDRQKAFPPAFFRDLARVGNGDYDAVIECSNRDTYSFSSALYACASRSPRRIGFAGALSRYYLNDEVRPLEGELHAARDPVILAAHLIGEAPPPLDALRLSVQVPSIRPAWDQTLQDLSRAASGEIVGIFVGGRGAKRWPLERFGEVCEGLLRAGRIPWIFSGPREPEVETVFGPMRDRGLVIMPRVDIIDVAQAFRRVRAVLAADSGPMHLASAVGAPTLGLFVSSDAHRYRPFGPHDRWIDARGGDLPANRVLRLLQEMLA